MRSTSVATGLLPVDRASLIFNAIIAPLCSTFGNPLAIPRLRFSDASFLTKNVQGQK
jgi:hypothetical protein